jgi:hypothetical protein
MMPAAVRKAAAGPDTAGNTGGPAGYRLAETPLQA